MIKLHNPYLAGGFEWLRGNLHTHTTISDGELAPEQVIALYERLGHDFLALTDHDRHAPAAEYQAGTRMVLVPGVEVTDRGPHLLQLGLDRVTEPWEDRQQVVDAITAGGGLAVMNHPNWQWHFNHFPQALMEQLNGPAGLEIYNGTIERLEGAALATDRWDQLLSKGKRVWGFANDDLHFRHEAGIAWNVVQARERTSAAVLEALREGRFYASTGVTIEAVAADGPAIHVHTRDAERIRFVCRWGAIQASFDDRAASWAVPDSPGVEGFLSYVRVECYGCGGRMAWTQPIHIERGM